MLITWFLSGNSENFHKTDIFYIFQQILAHISTPNLVQIYLNKMVLFPHEPHLLPLQRYYKPLLLIAYLIYYHHYWKLSQKYILADFVAVFNPNFAHNFSLDASETIFFDTMMPIISRTRGGLFPLIFCFSILPKKVNFSIYWQFSTPILAQKPHPFFYWNHQNLFKLINLAQKNCVLVNILWKTSAKTIANSYFCPEHYLFWVWKSTIMDHAHDQGQKYFKDSDREFN